MVGFGQHLNTNFAVVNFTKQKKFHSVQLCNVPSEPQGKTAENTITSFTA